MVAEAVEEVLDEVPGNTARARRREGGLEDEVAPAAQIERHPGERLVHRDGGVGEPGDPSPVADRLGKSRPEDDPDILNGVVGVHREIAGRADGKIYPPVPGERHEHVVEERYPGLDGSGPGSIE